MDSSPVSYSISYNRSEFECLWASCFGSLRGLLIDGMNVRDDVWACCDGIVLAGLCLSLGLVIAVGLERKNSPFQTERPRRARVGNILLAAAGFGFAVAIVPVQIVRSGVVSA